MATAAAATTTGGLITCDVDDVNADAPFSADSEQAGSTDETKAASTAKTRIGWVLIAELVVLVLLAGLAGWQLYRAHQSSAARQQRELFVQVGRQSVVNLTTIDWQHADGDVDRILGTATGSFRDDFASRSQSFIDVVRQSKSTTAGTVTEAGVESDSGSSAQILVAVTVKTSNAAAPAQESRSWRLRIEVQREGADVRVSNVEFVP